MKKLMTICLMVLLALPGIVKANVSWNYDSPLNVQENITDLGGGSYRYSYSFVNVDSLPIWGFGVYTDSYANSVYLWGSGGTTFTGHESWDGPDWASNAYDPHLDGSNLDPSIVGSISIDGWPIYQFIQPGESVSGFSFVAYIYDDSPKYYYYWTTATMSPSYGNVAAVGITGAVIPAPGAILLGGIGVALVGWLRRRRTL